MAQAFLPLLPDLGHVLVGESPPPARPSLDSEQEKRRRFEVLAHFLTTQAGKHPILLVVEDLHWSDDISLEFLHYLARRCAPHPLLLLLTYRSEEMHQGLRQEMAHLDREHLAQEIPLARLIGQGVHAEVVPFTGPTGEATSLHESVFSTIPGFPWYVGRAEHFSSQVPALAHDLNLQSHNAVQGTFRFVA